MVIVQRNVVRFPLSCNEFLKLLGTYFVLLFRKKKSITMFQRDIVETTAYRRLHNETNSTLCRINFRLKMRKLARNGLKTL